MKNLLLEKKLFDKGKIIFKNTKDNIWTLSSCGDFRAEGEISKIMGEKDFSYDEIAEVIKADIVLGNLEVPVINSSYIKNKCHVDGRTYSFIPESNLKCAKNMGFNIFNLANNHIKDFGPKGVLETIKYLKKYNINYFGAGKNKQDAGKYKIIKIKNTRVAFGGYSQYEKNEADNNAGANLINKRKIFSDIKKIKENSADLLIISLHHGYEFTDVPRIEFFQLCREIVDRGADLIFAHHPHVPLGMEKYRNGLIFYSLGNFLYKMPYCHTKENWTDKSFIPKLTFSGKNLCELEITPIYLDKGHILREAKNELRRKILSHLKKLSEYLNEKDIEKKNKDFIQFLYRILLEEIFTAGKRNDKNHLNKFINESITYDPYLKLFKDISRLCNIGDDFKTF